MRIWEQLGEAESVSSYHGPGATSTHIPIKIKGTNASYSRQPAQTVEPIFETTSQTSLRSSSNIVGNLWGSLIRLMALQIYVDFRSRINLTMRSPNSCLDALITRVAHALKVILDLAIFANQLKTEISKATIPINTPLLPTSVRVRIATTVKSTQSFIH